MKGWIFLLAFLNIGIGIVEGIVFHFMGILVDWLNEYTPTTLWQNKGHLLTAMAALLLFSILWAFVTSALRLQTLQGVFPMRLRWNFHRLMLGQSLTFYQDEFCWESISKSDANRTGSTRYCNDFS
ncbi:ABC transporter ATP-binding protein [Pasteurella canis]|nr:ABC transporter ATP-binding protein [Pasteurella canis]